MKRILLPILTCSCILVSFISCGNNNLEVETNDSFNNTVLVSKSSLGSVTLDTGTEIQERTASRGVDGTTMANAKRVRHTFSNGEQIGFENQGGIAVREGDIIAFDSKKAVSTILQYEKYLASLPKTSGASTRGVGIQPNVSVCDFWFIWCWSSHLDYSNRWYKRSIPYALSEGFSQSDKDFINGSVARWNARVSSVKWIPNSALLAKDANISGVIFLAAGAGYCKSEIGIMSSKPQYLYVTPACMSDRLLHHEMGHEAGLIHEQSRCDRDRFIQVYPENSIDGINSSDFKTYCNSYKDYGLYDFDSIMHYPANGLADPGKITLRVKEIVFLGYSLGNIAIGFTGNPYNFGNANFLSKGDLDTLDQIYK
jgi:Astacin (Peptidase family M12A)